MQDGTIKDELKAGRLMKNFTTVNGILCKIIKDGTNRFYLPDSLIDVIFEQYHEAVEAGHFGYKPTIQKIKQDFWFPNMEEIIQQRVAQCEKCLEFKTKTVNEGRAKAMKMPNNPFERIQMDMIGRFPNSKLGNQYVLVAIDVFTRFGIAKPVKRGTSKDVIIFLKSIFDLLFREKEMVCM